MKVKKNIKMKTNFRKKLLFQILMKIKKIFLQDNIIFKNQDDL